MHKHSSFRNLRSPFFLLIVIMFFSGCDNPAGYGGTSTISGKIKTAYYNEDYSMLIDEAPAVDEDVFLLFDENGSVGDKVVSGPDGYFEFTFLRPGTYTVYYMGEDSTTMGTDEEVQSLDIELTAGEDKDLGTLIELKTLEYNDGFAKITGVIKLINYKNSSIYPAMELKDISFAQDYEVYLIYEGHDFYDERIRTSYNGYFEFKNLIPGKYKVFTYSEDITGATEMITVWKNVSIEQKDEVVDLGEITVEQL